jgi:hypothetical protein
MGNGKHCTQKCIEMSLFVCLVLLSIKFPMTRLTHYKYVYGVRDTERSSHGAGLRATEDYFL